MEAKRKSNSFSEAGGQTPQSLGQEAWQMLKQNKKWWLAPIIIVLLVIGALLVLGATGAAPFIYALF